MVNVRDTHVERRQKKGKKKTQKQGLFNVVAGPARQYEYTKMGQNALENEFHPKNTKC